MLGLAIAMKNGQQLVAMMGEDFVSEAEDGGRGEGEMRLCELWRR